MKTCTKCQCSKDETEFYRNKRYGLTHWCKKCFKEAHDAKRQENPELWAERQRKAVLKHYYKYHEESKAILRNKQATPEFRQYARNWKRTPKGKVHVARYNSRRRELTQNDEKMTLEQVESLLETQHQKCNGCGGLFGDNLKYTLDHIFPVSKGGVLRPGNVQLLCRSCNSRKNNRLATGG